MVTQYLRTYFFTCASLDPDRNPYKCVPRPILVLKLVTKIFQRQLNSSFIIYFHILDFFSFEKNNNFLTAYRYLPRNYRRIHNSTTIPNTYFLNTGSRIPGMLDPSHSYIINTEIRNYVTGY
jgi:hypothetical protein